MALLTNDYPTSNYEERRLASNSTNTLRLHHEAVKWHAYVEGCTVGTIGIIIAGFGVLGEAYQFTALILV